MSANDLEENQNQCLYDRYDGRMRSYLLGAYKGHSVPVVEDAESKFIDKPGYYCRASKWVKLVRNPQDRPSCDGSQ